MEIAAYFLDGTYYWKTYWQPWLIWTKTALLEATKLTKASALWSSYHFATQVYADCKTFAEKHLFTQIYSMVFKCSHR